MGFLPKDLRLCCRSHSILRPRDVSAPLRSDFCGRSNSVVKVGCLAAFSSPPTRQWLWAKDGVVGKLPAGRATPRFKFPETPLSWNFAALLTTVPQREPLLVRP